MTRTAAGTPRPRLRETGSDGARRRLLPGSSFPRGGSASCELPRPRWRVRVLPHSGGAASSRRRSSEPPLFARSLPTKRRWRSSDLGEIGRWRVLHDDEGSGGSSGRQRTDGWLRRSGGVGRPRGAEQAAAAGARAAALRGPRRLLLLPPSSWAPRMAFLNPL
uniref:Uncharacterized protein n=1 Tax=Arundo donax TaxID=35708 RepID=A0A0A8Z3J4_ARUDO